MSDNGKGNTEVIEFEELALENTPTSSKEEQLATFLKDKLSEEDFGSAAKILGVDTEDLSNAELLEKLTELLQGKKEEKPEEKPEEETEMMDYKEYMKTCMAEGKPMEECQASFKEKYPDAKEEAADPEALAKKPDDNPELAALNNRVAELEGKLELEKISNEVAGLVTAKHLSPKQSVPVVKLGAGMTPEMRAEFFNLFKSQKYTVGEDKGKLQSKRPGDPATTMDPEIRARILKEQGISDLIAEKGIKVRNN